MTFLLGGMPVMATLSCTTLVLSKAKMDRASSRRGTTPVSEALATISRATCSTVPMEPIADSRSCLVLTICTGDTNEPVCGDTRGDRTGSPRQWLLQRCALSKGRRAAPFQAEVPPEVRDGLQLTLHS